MHNDWTSFALSTPSQTTAWPSPFLTIKSSNLFLELKEQTRYPMGSTVSKVNHRHRLWNYNFFNCVQDSRSTSSWSYSENSHFTPVVEEAGKYFLHLSRTYPDSHGFLLLLLLFFHCWTGFGTPFPHACYLGPYLHWDVPFCALASSPSLCHPALSLPHTHTHAHVHMCSYTGSAFIPSVPWEGWCYCRWRKGIWTLWHSLYYLLSNHPSLCIGCMLSAFLLSDCFLFLLFLIATHQLPWWAPVIWKLLF